MVSEDEYDEPLVGEEAGTSVSSSDGSRTQSPGMCNDFGTGDVTVGGTGNKNDGDGDSKAYHLVGDFTASK